VDQPPQVPVPVEDSSLSETSEATKPASNTKAPEYQTDLSPKEIEDGWISLFDGETLFGWKANNETNWTVSDGVIQADTAPKPGLLLTTTHFADFEFRCEYRLETGGNSGVFLRSVSNPTDPAVDCYEFNLCDSHEAFPTGSLVARAKPLKKVSGEGEWKTLSLIIQGPQITASINDEPVANFQDKSEHQLSIGHIGLQMNQGKIEFRKIYLKPLGLDSVFNGKDLSGWREVPGSKSEFTVDESAIQVTNGRGFLETEKTWGNFVLQLSAITHANHLNSGIFFRAMQGTEAAPSHGYEMQIHNGFKNDDPTQPMDFGTGAIFRRSTARRIIAKDQEWFTTVLVANGAHFSAWVNGYQVTDWTDERAANENPRKGLRIKAGHISIQGHDPTTDLSFKNLKIGELPSE